MKRRKSDIPMGSFNPSYHYEMLVDERRVGPFRAALAAQVGPEDVVLDIGTGSGLLAIMAARAGAAKVYAVERMADMRRVAEENFRSENNPALQLPIIPTDARDLSIPDVIDVLVCELLSTWLVTEQQAEVSRAARSYVSGAARFIPCRMINYATGVRADLSFFDARIGLPFYVREAPDVRPVALTDTIETHITDFRSVQDLEVRVEGLSVPIRSSGIINAVVIDSVADLGAGIMVDRGQTLFLPHVIPLGRDLDVQSGDAVKLRAAYRYGGGWENFSIDVARA